MSRYLGNAHGRAHADDGPPVIQAADANTKSLAESPAIDEVAGDVVGGIADDWNKRCSGALYVHCQPDREFGHLRPAVQRISEKSDLKCGQSINGWSFPVSCGGRRTS